MKTSGVSPRKRLCLFEYMSCIAISRFCQANARLSILYYAGFPAAGEVGQWLSGNEPTDLDIASVLAEFVPLSKLMAEQITDLRSWAKGRGSIGDIL